LTRWQQHHGASTYVDPGGPLDQILSSFYEKISTPVLTNIEVQIKDVTTYDTFPNPLPDLFQGSQLVITGRYREGGKTDILLKGRVNDRQQEFRYPSMQLTEESPSIPVPEASLPRLWAARKIGYLLNQIRLEGNDRETVDRSSGSAYDRIVTPYTSYL
jgi:Ca-activated chloride channel family protein